MDEKYSPAKALTEPLTKALSAVEFDRDEQVHLMEPMVMPSSSTDYSILADLALELASESASLRSSIPPPFVKALAVLVRAMNCYYSNLIEGHDTHPVDIERALKKEYSQDLRQRNLQLEAEAHINVQRWIDEGGISNNVFATETLLELHKRFCELLPSDLLWVLSDTNEKISVVPGELRQQNVKVGRHLAISPGSLPRFLARFDQAYSQLGKSEKIIAAAASHHRLLWMHPFLDGNGRVARLMSYALLLDVLGTGGIWSVARGLAKQQEQYKTLLMNCDEQRQGELDGRGALSESALHSFSEFFLRTCLDQVAFMKSLVRPDLLRTRVLMWAEEETALGLLPPRTTAVLETLLLLGELPRGQVQSILNASPATARRVISALTAKGVLISDSSRAPIRLAFPATLASLMSYALLLDVLGTGGIWSVARGLAKQQEQYKTLLMNCDEQRQGELDGRGALSESALHSFSEFFLRTCLDQVAFMKSLVRPDLLRTRVLMWAEEETALGLLPPRTTAVLETLLLLGELPRGQVQSILNASPATARRVISALTAKGVLISDSSRAPIRLAFPATLASRWLPGLFPEK